MARIRDRGVVTRATLPLDPHLLTKFCVSLELRRIPPCSGRQTVTKDVQDEHAPAWFDGNGRRVPPPQGGGFDVPAPAPPPPPPRTTLEAHDWGEAAESTLVAMLGTPPVPKATMGGAPVSF